MRKFESHDGLTCCFFSNAEIDSDLRPVSEKISKTPTSDLKHGENKVVKVISELKSLSRLKIFFQKLEPDVKA